MKWMPLVVLAWVMWAAVPSGQDDRVAVRLEQTAGITEDAARAFLDALRKNVGQGNHAAACAMVAYPLAHGADVVKDAADCESRYDGIFTIPVRKAIGKQQFEELFVNQSGAMIGMGEVWFAGTCASVPCRNVSDLHVTSIVSEPATLVPPRGKVLLACVVGGQRIRVSADGNGGASLGVWYAPRLTGSPEREFPRAEPAGPPSECGSRTWTFTDGARTYTVSDLPCDAYMSPPPMGSVGRVTLSTPSTPGVPLWCIE